MNIFHIATSLVDGGAEAVLYRLCTYDKQNRHTVISLMDSGKYGSLLEESGITVHCLGMPRGRITLTGLWRLWRLLRSERPDVVQTWMYHADFLGGIVARLAGIPIVCWGIHHSNLEPGKSTRTTILVARMCAWLSHWIPHAIVSCSVQAASVHQALGYAKEKFTIIPNGYNIVEFAPDPEARVQLRSELGLEKTILLGMVARYDPQKDHANLVNALGLIKHKNESFQCLLVGTDMDTNNRELCRLIEDQDVKDNVLLLGRRHDIPRVMNALDINILSSGFGEAFPNVLAEAMACGTPCITTDVGDAAVIVGDTGWIAPPSNSELLANAISEAIAKMHDTEKWAVRKSMCRERVVSNFSLELMVDNYHNVWKSFT